MEQLRAGRGEERFEVLIKDPRNTLPYVSSKQHLQVLEHRLLDGLPHRCTTSAPIWHRLKNMVVSHETRLLQLLDAAAHVLSLSALANQLTSPIATLIEEFGGFKMILATLHSLVARERCAGEVTSTTVPQAIKKSCRLVVSTISSLVRQRALAELCKDLGPCTRLLGGDGTRTTLDVFLNAYVKEVVSVSLMSTPDPHTGRDPLYGFCDNNGYDGNIAIHAVVAAFTAGSLHLRLRRSFDECMWERCFSSLDEARHWKSAPISVVVVCMCAEMVELCYEAMLLVQSMESMLRDRDINVSCATADAVQEDMYSIMVLALPPTTSSWTTWHCDSHRVVNAVSRCQYQLMMTYIEDDSLPDQCTAHKDSVQVILDLQKSARQRWTWTTMQPDMSCQPEDFMDLWASWIRKYERWCTSTEPQDQDENASLSSASTTHTSICPSAMSYPKSPFLILRYIQWLVRVMMNHNLDVRTWVREIRCRLQRREGMRGKRIIDPAIWWLESDILPNIHVWQTSMFRIDGTVISFLSELSKTKTVQAFSALVLGLGDRRTNILADGRMECLVLQLVFTARRELEQLASDRHNRTWIKLEKDLDSKRKDIVLSVAIAPRHERSFYDVHGDAAADAGEKARIMLLAQGDGHAFPTVLGWAYHATSIPQSTTSMAQGQMYGKGRILWDHNFLLHDITNRAAVTLANQLHVAAPTLDAELLDHALIGDSVFQQQPIVVTPLDATASSLHSSESDFHNSESDKETDI